MLLHDSATAATPDVERVRSAIARLSPADRDLLVRRFRDGRTSAELAEAAGTSVEFVRRRLHRAAWRVQDVVGATPRVFGDDEPQRLRDRPADLVEEEAELGITPLLAARLVAAVTGTPPAADDHWRLHALLRRLRGHGDGLATMLLVAGVVAPVLGSLASGGL